MVSGLGDTKLLVSNVSSTSEGVRTARVTAVHTLCRASGDHSSRADGWASKAEKSVRMNLEPSVSHRCSRESEISSCGNAVNILSRRWFGVKLTVGTTGGTLASLK